MAEEKIKPEKLPASEFLQKPIDNHLKIVLFSLLGLIFAGGLVYGGYLLGQKQAKLKFAGQSASTPASFSAPSPTSDETASWKTYSDKILFFRYPLSWEVDSPGIFGTRTVVEFNYKLTPTFTLSEISYNEETGKPYASLNEYVGASRVGISKDIVVGVYPAKRITFTMIPPELEGHVIPYEEVILFVPDKSSLISLYYQKDYYDKPNSDKILDQILSTFKFLEKVSGERVECTTPRPEVCTMECITNPPYICGSDGESYCSECQACSNQNVEWYITQSDPCGI